MENHGGGIVRNRHTHQLNAAESPESAQCPILWDDADILEAVSRLCRSLDFETSQIRNGTAPMLLGSDVVDNKVVHEALMKLKVSSDQYTTVTTAGKRATTAAGKFDTQVQDCKCPSFEIPY